MKYFFFSCLGMKLMQCKMQCIYEQNRARTYRRYSQTQTGLDWNHSIFTLCQSSGSSCNCALFTSQFLMNYTFDRHERIAYFMLLKFQQKRTEERKRKQLLRSLQLLPFSRGSRRAEVSIGCWEM